MEQEPKLRSVPPTGPAGRGGVNARAEATPPQSRVPIVLGTALAVVLVLLIWSYLALGSRIDVLVGEAEVLRAAVAERDELINAQRARLDEVRGRIQELLTLIEQPVSGALPVVPDEPVAPAPESP
jgi:hypothetical protein